MSDLILYLSVAVIGYFVGSKLRAKAGDYQMDWQNSDLCHHRADLYHEHEHGIKR